jgi:hypothetical protein
MVAVESLGMAKSKRGRPPEGGKGKPVRMAADVLDKARVVAAASGVPMSDYLANLLRPLVDRDYRALARRMSEEGK